ncbi:uncharacterized protein LOC111456732 [Cucurbita moschata]|uniref:Uncharacterized protein LOC111456732 n=1 Tax=Cucurbita moschata TaxID=3662 RepID=A0A6J1GQZ5_CUCMO|nr:uncharacterized protein LOC111456732 [Cucurbita moschata]
MESRISRENTREMAKLGHIIVQKRLANSRPKAQQQAPDLTDFMNDMFFGSVNKEKKAYNLTGDENEEEDEEEQEDSFDRSNRSRNSLLTEEWLDEARRLVASSPSRPNSPARFVGSPRFAAANGRSSALINDRRDPLSRSARRHRAVDNFSGEILSKVVRHSRNKSESFSVSSAAVEEPINPSSAVQKWISNVLKPSNPTLSDPPPTTRKSRFHTDLPPSRLPIPPPDVLLSPPKTLTNPPPRRTVSSSACSIQSIRPKSNLNEFSRDDSEDLEFGLNGFLKEQRSKIQQISDGQLDVEVKIILSGPSNSTSSMVAAVCYAWLLENKMKQSNAESGRECLVVPVMNMQRGNMWNQRQVAWLFYHLGLDASSILFTDEVDLESLMVTGRTSVLVVGQDVLKMSDGVGSQCTILTDNYCEDAYHLLQTPLLKNLMLAGILLDTKNLDGSAQLSMTRDAEAVQLLSVGSAPNCRNGLYDQLMRVQKERPFLDALQQSYGKPPDDGSNDGAGHVERIMERNRTSISPHDDTINQQKKPNDFGTAKTCRASPKSAKPSLLPIQTPARETPNISRGKNKNFLAKWFGFGSK